MKETNIQREAMMAASDLGLRIFRNNVGIAQYPDGSVVVYGLCTGSSDLIGWTPVTVTPEMVGQQLAVFTAFEIKTRTGRVTPDQINFISQVNQAGGIATVIRSATEIKDIIHARFGSHQTPSPAKPLRKPGGNT